MGSLGKAYRFTTNEKRKHMEDHMDRLLHTPKSIHPDKGQKRDLHANITSDSGGGDAEGGAEATGGDAGGSGGGSDHIDKMDIPYGKSGKNRLHKVKFQYVSLAEKVYDKELKVFKPSLEPARMWNQENLEKFQNVCKGSEFSYFRYCGNVNVTMNKIQMLQDAVSTGSTPQTTTAFSQSGQIYMWKDQSMIPTPAYLLTANWNGDDTIPLYIKGGLPNRETKTYAFGDTEDLFEKLEGVPGQPSNTQVAYISNQLNRDPGHIVKPSNNGTVSQKNEPFAYLDNVAKKWVNFDRLKEAAAQDEEREVVLKKPTVNL